MVAKIIIGKHIGGILGYNEHKVQKGTAALLGAENSIVKAENLSLKQKLHLFSNYTESNRRAKTNAVHISLNFDKGDKLNDELLKEISQQYIELIGFAEQPYLLYRHYDAAHPHVHIVTTNIQSNGERIDLHNIGKYKSEPARKQLENEFRLVKAESKRKQEEISISPVNLKKATYGKDETKQAITNIVRFVTRNWKYASLPELNAILNQYNVIADPGEKDSTMFQKQGLVYYLLDPEGKKIGVPIKASSIYGRPTLKFLEKRFALNEILRLPLKQPLKDRIDKTLQSKLTQENFKQILARDGIQVIFRRSEEDKVYGVTFVDHKSRAVFNGSSLGKSYSAKHLIERLGKENLSITIEKAKSATQAPHSDNDHFFKLSEQEQDRNSLLNVLLKPDHTGTSNRIFERKRKKRHNHQ